MTRTADRIHVAHVIGALQTGGAEMMLVNFLGAVDRDRYRHTVLCLTAEGEMADRVRDLGVGVRVHRVRFRRFPLDLRSMAAWFRKEDVRIVHSHMFFASLWSRCAGLLAGVPCLVTTEHGKEPWKKPWQIRLDRFLSGRTFHHIAVSDDVRNIRIERDGIPPERITLIPNGVPVSDAAADPETGRRVRAGLGIGVDVPVVGTVGRVIEAKDYPLMLDVLALARERHPDLHWLQVGDGPDRKGLVRLAENRGMSGGITFAGMRQDVPDLLAAMDVWAMSSIREGLPVALLEAMAAGLPIVGTDVGGIPDAVDHGVSALLSPARDAAAMAANLAAVLGDSALARRLGEAARARVAKDFSIRAVAGRIEDIYARGCGAG